jgi:hypothetical protein
LTPFSNNSGGSLVEIKCDPYNTFLRPYYLKSLEKPAGVTSPEERNDPSETYANKASHKRPKNQKQKRPREGSDDSSEPSLKKLKDEDSRQL